MNIGLGGRQMAKIRNIYLGKHDAKDEIETEGFDAFFANYVIPPSFNFDSITKGSGSVITGLKGTGKTAILYYIDDLLKKSDMSTLSSFIFFKGDFSDSKKQELEILSKRLTSIVTIDDDVVLSGTDFEYIWRWILYTRIVKDNEDFNGGIFVDNKEWDAFKKKIEQLDVEKKRHWLLPHRLKLSVPVSTNPAQPLMTPTVEVDFKDSKVQETMPYKEFVRIIDEADILFKSVERTDIPYYIFVDELEAYYGNKDVFERDLCMIRDLVFTVKKINMVFAQHLNLKTKIICSVRTEVINAINRYIIPKELNKVIAGFEVPLIWDYTNTNSYNHPIMKILINRITYGGERLGETVNEVDLIRKWFPEKINKQDPATYILNNSWCKPRDIVRLISSAQNCIAAENDSFSQKTMDMCRKRYSVDSLLEIKEELRALYTPQEIESIENCFTGFKKIFSYSELIERIKTYYENTVLREKTTNVLSDLYRVGMIGNFFPEAKTYRWQHKSDDNIIIDSKWKMIIHPALQSALSVNLKQDSIRNQFDKKIIGTNTILNITKIRPNHVRGRINIEGNIINAYLPIYNMKVRTSTEIPMNYHLTDEINVKILEFNERYNTWTVSEKNEH